MPETGPPRRLLILISEKSNLLHRLRPMTMSIQESYSRSSPTVTEGR